MSAYPNELNLGLYLDRDNLENYKIAQGSWGFPIRVWLKKSDDTLMDLSGCTVRLKAVKSDNTIGYWDGAINSADSTEADWTAQPQLTAATGDVQLIVEITTLESGIQSIPCKLKVVAMPDSQIVSSNDFKALTQQLSQVQPAVQLAQKASEQAEKSLADVTATEKDIAAAETARELASQTSVNNADTAIKNITQKQTAMDTAESARELASQTAVGNADAATTRADAAADKANHVPQRDASGVWKDWDAESQTYKTSTDPWKGEKGDAGANFAYGESYATLEALQAAYPQGDTKGHLVGGTACIWDGAAWVATSVDLTEYYKKTESDAKYAGINHTHTAAQVGARPDTWTPTAADVGARPSTWTPTASDVGLGRVTNATNTISTSAPSGGLDGDTWDVII